MHRFFLPADTFDSRRVRITGEVAEQVRRVLRLRPGDALTLLDGLGNEYHAILHSYGSGEAWADLLRRESVTTEPRVHVSLYLSLLNKPDKFEWALQKCTELGAARFIPVTAERSVADRPSVSRLERWERILREAAEQSGRGVVPSLAEAMSLRDALSVEQRKLSEQGGGHVGLLPEVGQERNVIQALGSIAHAPATVSLFIGPEGGFTQAEVNSAMHVGIIGVTLGRRTLRSETAAITAVALVMSALGEMG